MNRILAFLFVVLCWVLSPIVILLLAFAVALSISWAASQVLYEYVLRQLNERKNNERRG